jgi:nucleoside-diphosphate-sugar epimerase
VARIVIIGGRGHFGTYLAPALVERGHDVVKRQPRYSGGAGPPHPAWKAIEQVLVDRKAEVAERKSADGLQGLMPTSSLT